MAEHAPGPWHIDGPEIIAADGGTVAIWDGRGLGSFGTAPQELQEANARLIAAAPRTRNDLDDLLAAAKAVLADAVATNDEVGVHDTLRDVIEKAEVAT